MYIYIHLKFRNLYHPAANKQSYDLKPQYYGTVVKCIEELIKSNVSETTQFKGKCLEYHSDAKQRISAVSALNHFA